jgi:thiamine biosynthesis lipoprotein
MSIPRAGLTPRAKLLLPVFLVVLLVASYFRLVRAPTGGDQAVFEGQTMGTTYRVVVAGPSPGANERRELEQAIAAELDRVDGLMSTYRKDSELSRFNRSQSTAPFPVSADTAQVVKWAQLISEQSGGAFDVTVRPLVAAWGFGAGAHVEPPDADELAQLRARVGYRRLSVEGQSLRKTRPDVSVDLSAIAKGYAVDRVSQVLRDHGRPAHMVEVGGEVRVSGKKADGSSWRIGIEQPDSDERQSRLVIKLHDVSMATSGDYRNYFERDGVRVSHTIDPRTGKPITHNLASVSVLNETCALADGYATALDVLGPDDAYRLAEQLKLAAFFIVRTANGGFETRSTSAFDALGSNQ